MISVGNGWVLWPCVELRGAGFPARWVLELSAPELREAAERLVDAEHEHGLARAGRIADLWSVFRGRGENALAARRAAQSLERGKLLDDSTLEQALPALRDLRQLASRVTDLRAEYDRIARAAQERVDAALNHLATDPRLREALRWQNASALHAADRLARTPTARNAKDRQNQHLVATYLQRYCVKNDQIGFFGPIAWGEISPVTTTSFEPGPTLLRERAVYLEHWAVDALAATINRWDGVRPYAAPRLLPFARLDGTTLHVGERAIPLSPPVARVLSACTGEATAIGVPPDPDPGVHHPAEGYELLASLLARKLIVWELEPSAVVRPDLEMRRLVERIETEEPRTRALEVLDQIESRRAAVSAAAGDVERLDRALDDLDTTFRAITDRAPTRPGGGIYAARTLR